MTEQNMVDIPPVKGMEKTIEPVGIPSWHDEYIGAANTAPPIVDTQPEETP